MNVALDAILEIFTWVGLGAGALVGLIALGLWAADGSWLPAQAVVDHEDGRTVVRWFDDAGGVGAADAGHAEAETLAGVSTADIWYRLGARDRFRLTRRSPAVRAAAWLAAGLAAVGIAAFAASWIVLFAA
ncbi:hypothetical protein NQ166_01140 [Microbacterium sp. zg.Y1090]|uniref:hypothetical protein n=1 Tax=Microbacterium wangruii TaxID=3049073 RepID=UPI00214CD63A|nr:MULTISPECIES: hypothetical protein [unclassified Microbacterium]MCR2817433.1 hypothetical protein [Microbacterium sp. zg.Y1090]MDL5485923.1 hypothetical protein [Microbacterium sp. zg-Y1211]WIM29081.1 hypothetical protein QNO26_04070 [Microbacterium sp. zg-Y1090]